MISGGSRAQDICHCSPNHSRVVQLVGSTRGRKHHKGLGLLSLQTSLAKRKHTQMPVAQISCLSVLLISQFCLAAPFIPNPSCEYATLKGKCYGRGLHAGLPLAATPEIKRLQEARIWMKDKRHICCVLWRTNAAYKICLIAELIIPLKSKCWFLALPPLPLVVYFYQLENKKSMSWKT